MVPQEFDCRLKESSCLKGTKKQVSRTVFQGQESSPQKTGEKQEQVTQAMSANQLFHQ